MNFLRGTPGKWSRRAHYKDWDGKTRHKPKSVLLCLSLIISTALLGIKACTAALHFVNLTVEHALEWERHVAGSEIVFYLQTAVFAKGCFDGGLG